MMTVRVHLLDEAGNEAKKDSRRAHPCIRVRYAFAPATFIGESMAAMAAPIEGWAQIGWPGHDCEIRADRIPTGTDADRAGTSKTYGMAIEFLDANGDSHIVPAQASVMPIETLRPFDLAIGKAFFLDALRWEDESGGSWLTFRLPPRTYLDFM